MNASLFSSKKMDYCTPQAFFDKLNEEFRFSLDAAATDRTAKCPAYFTPETDGLKSSWSAAGGGRCFLQPALWAGNREVGGKSPRRGKKRADSRSTYPGPNRYELFPRPHLRVCGNPVYSRAVAIYGRGWHTISPGSVSFDACYLQRERRAAWSVM